MDDFVPIYEQQVTGPEGQGHGARARKGFEHASVTPVAVCLLIFFLYVTACVYPGANTWAFNSIAYVSEGVGLMTTIACAAVALWSSRIVRMCDELFARQRIAVLVICAIAAIFIVAVVGTTPLFPELEGDGNLGDHPGENRLRGIVIRALSECLDLDLGIASVVFWKYVGAVYAFIAIPIAFALAKRPHDAVVNYLLLVVSPAAIGFIGYVDSSSMMLVFETVCLAASYVAATTPVRRKRCIALVIGVLALWASCLEHRSYLLMLPYFAFFGALQFCDSRRLSPVFKQRIIGSMFAGFMAVAVLQSYLKGAGKDVFATVVVKDGLASALYHPLILMLSFLIPYAVAAMALCGIHAGSLTKLSPALGAALWGSLGNFFAFYLHQQVGPQTGFGILDMVAIATTTGGLYGVPTVLFVQSHGMRRHMWCIVALALFITVPNFMVHGSGVIVPRLRASLPGLRTEYYATIGSPYLHVGLKFKDVAQRSKDPAMKELCYAVFEDGATDSGYYARGALQNVVFLTCWQYEFGDVDRARQNLDQIMRLVPRACMVFLERFPCYTRHSDQARLKDVHELSGKYLEETGLLVYRELQEKAAAALEAGQDRWLESLGPAT